VAKSLLARAIATAGGAVAFRDRVGQKRAAALVRRAKLLGPPEADDEYVAWRAVGRPEQILPEGAAWLVWLILAGRGFGKTRTGAEAVLEWVKTGVCRRLALVAPTAGDARDVMVEGESGIKAVSQADGFPAFYEPSKRRITWPNGAIATLYSAEEPDRLRGPQHDGGWCDEIAVWDDAVATWDMLQFGMRLGSHPRIVVTTTPRPVPIIRKLIGDLNTVVTRGSTFDNSENLAPAFLTAIRAAYEGTRLGRQELFAEILDDNPGALWKMAQIDLLRVVRAPGDMKKIGVGVDPAVSSSADSDETGIVTAGVADCPCKGASELHGFVIADNSGIYTPDGWAKAVAKAYHDVGADKVVPEVNNGGDLVVSNLLTLGDRNLSIVKGPSGRYGVHASRGKQTRAEPISGLYEQGKVHHIGTFPKLEDQLTQWNPLTDKKSPDRLDAMVWALSWLMLAPPASPILGLRW
jgi:phage terminase large subunit-like protein